MTHEQTERGSLPIGTPIVIDERPLCFWSFDDRRVQAEFLESIDSGYFAYLGRTHESRLEGEDNLYAAVALRVAYSHALESLFALIGAAVQAPQCPAGWVLKYTNADLNGLLEKITERKPFHNKLRIDRGSWPSVATALSPWQLPGDTTEELRSATAKLWRFLAKEFLDRNFEDEYNSLKHGLRVRAGGWYLAIGVEDVPGIPAPPERMRVMAQSRFGSSFLRPVSLKKHHWAFEDQRVNWSPAVFAKRLPLVVESMNNVLAFLKLANGLPTQTIRVSLINHGTVEEALSDPDHASSTKFSFRSHIVPEIIPNASAQDILATYLDTSEPGDESRATT